MQKQSPAQQRLAKQLWEKVKDTNVPQLLRALINTHPLFGGGKGDFAQIVKELADYPDRETVVELLALNLENTDLMDPTISLDVAHTWGDALVAMGEDAVERLIACLDHENFWVRIVAVSTLRRIGDRRAVQPLIKILQESPSGRVASLVADALGQIAGPDSDVINALTKTVEEGDSMSRPSAKAALNQLSSKHRLLEDTASFCMEGVTALNMSGWELRWHLKQATGFISYGEETSNPWEAADMLYDHAWKEHVEPLCDTGFPAAISLRDTIISDLEIAAAKAEDRYGAEYCRELAESIRSTPETVGQT